MVYYTIYIKGYCKSKTQGACYSVVYTNGKMIGEDGISINQGVTPNRCNLAAVLIGLRMVPNNARVIVVSDDEYTIKSVMKINRRVHNLDILNAIDEEIMRKKSCEYRWLDLSKEKERMIVKYCEKACKNKCSRAINQDLLEYNPETVKSVVAEAASTEEIIEKIDDIGRELINIKKYLKERLNG